VDLGGHFSVLHEHIAPSHVIFIIPRCSLALTPGRAIWEPALKDGSQMLKMSVAAHVSSYNAHTILQISPELDQQRQLEG